ncbi:hypothetical protein F2Q68_00028276 [Brassica cretica]|uniref:SBP-type domain-containing protein n=1 Tax=Brassica cretica TaxID=69181 RepID=A0A8S9IH39_BRACR|nr:hypothetical protein F2Q68_00028276 [Brassica cretica]
MNMGSNSGQGLGPGQAESGGSSNESSSFSGGLMFGQKIYFEDGVGGSSSSGGSNRRVRGGGSGQSSQIPRCQVEGCGVDLTNAKGYYLRHRVCGMHSKTPRVIVAGIEQRFCQQCSRPKFVIRLSLSTTVSSRLLKNNKEHIFDLPLSSSTESLISSFVSRILKRLDLSQPLYDPSSHYCVPFICSSNGSKGTMDPAEMRYLEEEDGPMMKTIKGSVTGFAAGTIYGTILATWKDVPRVERNVALPGLIRTLKMMGTHGLTFAAIGGVYIGVEQVVQGYRGKRDFFNGAIGGFVAGASVLGYRARSIPTAIAAGATLAVTSALIDSGGFGPMTVTMAQPPPAPSQHQYLNPPWVFKDDDNNCPNDMSPVLNLARFTETDTTMGEFELSDHHQHQHQNRRQYMEDENTRAYDSSSHHNNWSL